MKTLKVVLLLLCLLMVANSALGQTNPTVEIVLSQPTAVLGDIITADVYVRGAVNVAGADIGIIVDEECLRIIDRQPGSFLPSSADGGSFSAFSELHDHDTRIAVAITDRSKIANGDGIFFQTQLEVTCEQSIAPLTVTFVQLGAYVDPSAAEVELVAYTLAADTVTAINAQLIIGTQDGVTAEPAPTTEAGASVEPITTPVIAPVVPVVETTSQNQSPVVIILIIIVVVGIGLPILYVATRRRRDQDDVDDLDDLE